MTAIVVPRRLDVAVTDHALHDLATKSPLSAPTQHILPNGIKIIAEQIPVDAVNLSIWVDVGSAVESDDINGMAHFLEHMVFKGSDRLNLENLNRRSSLMVVIPMRLLVRTTPIFISMLRPRTLPSLRHCS